MKAILHTRYGDADRLRLTEMDAPVPKDDKVVIAIHATTVSTGDCNMRNFTFVTKSMRPFAKLMFGIGRPWTARVLGTELAGEVKSVGRAVTRFKKGDRIVASTGMAGGGHGQYACLPERGALALKPESLSWEEAVAIPFGRRQRWHRLSDEPWGRHCPAFDDHLGLSWLGGGRLRSPQRIVKQPISTGGYLPAELLDGEVEKRVARARRRRGCQPNDGR